VSDEPEVDVDRLLSWARAQGLPLARERAAALLPAVSSLLGRLAGLAPELSPGMAPPPEAPSVPVSGASGRAS
jgi:hypothetical protein